MEDFMDLAGTALAMATLIGSFNSDIRLVWPQWKYKCLTFSYDDATVYDRKLVEIFNRYGMKGTFNVSSNRLDRERYLSISEIAELYAGHEIACHGKNHLRMPDISSAEQEREIVDDINSLSRVAGYPVLGFAYPYAKTSPELVKNLQKQNIAYARICNPTGDFRLPDALYLWAPTGHHKHNIAEIADRYKDYNPWGGVISLCYIWGHSYEFNRDNNWHVIEEFCQKLAHHPDIWYASNIEIVRYLQAYRTAASSLDCTRFCNTSAVTLYLMVNGQKVKLAPGETLRVDSSGSATIAPRPADSLPVPAVVPADRMIFYPDGSRKALAFSYDDGGANDERLAVLLKKYNCKGSFNFSGRKLLENPAQSAWYQEHEIATHGLRHTTATLASPNQVLHDIVLDRKVLETLSERIVNGHAWPNGSTFGAPEFAQDILSKSGIIYARGTRSTNAFELPENLMCWEPTAKAVPAALDEISSNFAAEGVDGELKLCTVWGHSWEYKEESDWQALEKFCAYWSDKKVWRASFGEIARYIIAVRSLEWTPDRKMVRNPSGETIYIGKAGKLCMLRPGEIITFQ